ncbi:hypothetical protein GCM10027168_11820 [Streptomyces capparidis]
MAGGGVLAGLAGRTGGPAAGNSPAPAPATDYAPVGPGFGDLPEPVATLVRPVPARRGSRLVQFGRPSGPDGLWARRGW